jgi:hypothetical protein
VCVDMDGETVAEADVFASLMTPLREQRVVLECKGGQPKPTDIRKFAPMRSLLYPSPDELLLVVRHGYADNRKALAAKLGVRVIERTNLAYYSLPLLGGVSLRAFSFFVLVPFSPFAGVNQNGEVQSAIHNGQS